MNEYVEYLSDNKSFKYDNLEAKCPNDLIKVNSNNYKIFLFKNYHLGNSQNDIWEIKLTSSNIFFILFMHQLSSIILTYI